MEDDVYQSPVADSDMPVDSVDDDAGTDYILQEIDGTVKGLDAKLDDFLQNGYTPYDDEVLVEKVDVLSAKADQILSLNEQGESLREVSSVEYVEQLDNIQQLLSYQCGLLVVLSMLVVIVMGVIAGSLVTRWWRART